MKHLKANEGAIFNPALHIGTTSRQLVSKDTPAQYATIHITTLRPGGGGNELDAHPESEQTFYILSGEVTFRGEHGKQVVRAGEAIFIPAGELHASLNESDAEAVCLVVTAPPL